MAGMGGMVTGGGNGLGAGGSNFSPGMTGLGTPNPYLPGSGLTLEQLQQLQQGNRDLTARNPDGSPIGNGGPAGFPTSVGGFQGNMGAGPGMGSRSGDGKSNSGQMAQMKQLYMMARMKAAMQAAKNKQMAAMLPKPQSGNISFQAAMNAGKPTMANANQWATAGNPLFANTWGQPNQVMPPTANGKVNPWGLSDEQITWALSGSPKAYMKLMDSLGAAGGQDPRTGAMTPENLKFHQIINWYEAGGGGFNGGGYTAQDAFDAQKAMEPDWFKPMNFQANTPVYQNMADYNAGKQQGTATGVGQYYNQP